MGIYTQIIMEKIRIEEDEQRNVISNGLHYLSGIDDTIVPNYWNEEGEGYDAKLFCIDNQTYLVYEDPDDGYRSYGSIEKTDKICTYRFEPQAVIALNKVVTIDDDEYNYCQADKHILVLTDAITGKEVLTIGTDYADGYYPVSIFDYQPQNMYINQNK